MKRHVTLSTAAAMIVLGTSSVASAQVQEGFNVHRFEPSERGSEWFAGESLDLRGAVRPALGIVGDYSYRSLVVYDADGEVKDSVVRNNLFGHLGGSLVLADRFRLSVSLPVQLFADGHTGGIGGRSFLPPPNEQGIGDLRLGADVRLFGEYGDAVTGAIGVQVWAPTGDRAQYTSDKNVRIRPRFMLAGDIGSFVYSAQVNVTYRARAENIAGGEIGSDIGFVATAGLRVADKKLVIGPEIFGSTVFEDPFAKRTTPIEALLGMHYTIGNDVRVGAGVGPGLTRGYGSPEFRGLLSFEWVPGIDEDRDGDGIKDKDDACPSQAGIRTDDPKTNGCPAAEPVPSDRDGDGVLDTEDACIDVPGEKTDDPATNGCPADKDKDGVPDSVDACVDVPGVKSDDPKKNGCPPDRDGDGVLDAEDACPDVAGLKTSDPKTNGCPDPDRDKDNIANEQDACPDEPGKPDPDPKKNGCPKAFVAQGQIKIIDQVKFKTGSAAIEKSKDSEEVLEAVLTILKQHVEITKVRVEGHTDNVGKPASNKKLSADRAASVVRWLSGKGIDKSRLASEGFGEEKPIDTNETEQGRKNNRRVEFHIDAQAPSETKVETK